MFPFSVIIALLVSVIITTGTLNQRLWVQQDANWDVTALVNGSGAVVERSCTPPMGSSRT